MFSQRESDRQRVLELVQQSINQGMDSESVNRYMVDAKEYGKKHSIETPIKYWIAEGRNIYHAIPEERKRWAESLP